MTTVTIKSDYSLAELKNAYKIFFGLSEKPTKKDIISWFGYIVSAEIQDILHHDSRGNEE